MLVYNSELVIEKSIKETEQKLRSLDVSYGIIVVDDGSRDATRQVLSSVKNTKVRVLSYDVNQGVRAFALKSGALNVRGDYVIFMDGVVR